MTVAYPRKLRNAMGAREILAQVVRDRELHLMTLNRYRYSEQRSCKDLTDVIERLDGEPPELVRDLSRHVSDEARHSMWLTDLLVDLGQNVGTPPGISYIDEFDRLLDKEQYDPKHNLDDSLIAGLVAINVTEKRGCEFFSAHIHALKQAPQTAENVKIRETIEKIFPEEAGHVRWSNRWLAKSPTKARNTARRWNRQSASMWRSNKQHMNREGISCWGQNSAASPASWILPTPCRCGNARNT